VELVLLSLLVARRTIAALLLLAVFLLILHINASLGRTRRARGWRQRWAAAAVSSTAAPLPLCPPPAALSTARSPPLCTR
jgi:hypothetical protein